MPKVFSSFAVYPANGGTFATKKALREAVTTNPASVMITDLSMFGGVGTFLASDIVTGDEYHTLVGPDAHRNRKWYANILRDAKGNLKVK